MPSPDPIPQARVVSKAGQLIAPPRAPRTEPPSIVVEQARNVLGIMLGLWPLTSVLLLMVFLTIVGVNLGSP